MLCFGVFCIPESLFCLCLFSCHFTEFSSFMQELYLISLPWQPYSVLQFVSFIMCYLDHSEKQFFTRIRTKTRITIHKNKCGFIKNIFILFFQNKYFKTGENILSLGLEFQKTIHWMWVSVASWSLLWMYVCNITWKWHNIIKYFR